jgi:hypothetical protein
MMRDHAVGRKNPILQLNPSSRDRKAVNFSDRERFGSELRFYTRRMQ